MTTATMTTAAVTAAAITAAGMGRRALARLFDQFALDMIGHTAERRRRAVAGLLLVVVVAALLAAVSDTANAQFGALKRLKNSISPDSAARVEALKQDSIALATRRAAGDTTPLQRSKFARAVSAASSATSKLESATGMSAKDMALAATGVGASALVARKLGGDPLGMGAKALTQPTASKPAPRTTAMPDGGATLHYTAADAQTMAAFQQEMMQVAMAASAGDAAAAARLEQWQAITLRYEAEIEKLALTSDVAALQRLQTIQVEMIREWAKTGPTKAARPPKTMKPAKTATAVKP